MIKIPKHRIHQFQWAFLSLADRLRPVTPLPVDAHCAHYNRTDVYDSATTDNGSLVPMVVT